MSRIDILGVPFDNMMMDEAVDYAMNCCAGQSAAYVVTPNPEIVMSARENRELMEAIRGADFVLPDGIGVIYGARILGSPLQERIPGIDFAVRLMERLSYAKSSVFLFGAKPGVAEQAGENLKERFPGDRKGVV